MASVSLQNLGKVFPARKNGSFWRSAREPEVQAVRDVSLDIADGEFVVLVGPSGCGKSTTLRMVAGLEDPTSGTVSIGGRVVNDVHPKDRDIAMVFQNYALYPHMTVAQNMGFALKLRRVPRAEVDRRVRETARTLGIEDLLRRRPGELSGGQRQRVAVGRAIVREPKAFLFDEPLSNLDAALRVSMRAELKGLHQRLRTTTIYVTHDQEEAMTLGDRIVVMHRGRVQQAGPPLEVYARPANRFVASFIGTPRMNFIEGVIEPGPLFVERTEAAGPAQGQSSRIPLSASVAERIAGKAGRAVVLGIRPQALSEVAGGGGAPTVTLRVQVVEPLGDQMDVIGQTPAGTRIVARLPARPGVGPGADIRLAIDATRVHCFESADGETAGNLLLDGAGSGR
jgi:multiple sugar transport system ATP-binding protein